MENLRGGRGHRHLGAMNSLGRRRLSSYYRLAKEEVRGYRTLGETTRDLLRALKIVAGWLTGLFSFATAHRFVKYPPGRSGVYTFDENPLSLVLAGDWASGTTESALVGQRMSEHAPDLTIHLGDTYYIGTEREIRDNYFDRVIWPIGRRGSLALLGNHEMFSEGKGYFDILLQRLGVRSSPDDPIVPQHSAYFCIDTADRRIIGVDTGYHSASALFPVRIDAVVLRWLRDVVKLDDPTDRRGIVLLTHHQYFSAFPNEPMYRHPLRQLRPLLKGRTVMWLWGHEHRMAVYQPVDLGDQIVVHARCIGHGGMPVAVDKEPDKGATWPLVMYDDRRYPNEEGLIVGYNGYAYMQIDGEDLHITYNDLEGHTVYRETWRPGALLQ
jgi:hypothetical protein